MDNHLQDKETIQILTEGTKATDIVSSETYAYLKDRFMEKLLDLQSIKNLPDGTPEQVVMDIKARNTAMEIILEVFKELEGKAEQYKGNQVEITEEFSIHKYY